MGVERAARLLDIDASEGGILSPTIRNNKSEIVKSLEEIRGTTESNFHETNPKIGTPARLFFDNAFKAMDMLEKALTKESGLYIADFGSADDPKSFIIANGLFNPEKPDRIYIRADSLLPEQGFDESKMIERLTDHFQEEKLELEKSSYPDYLELAKNINPVDDAKSIVKKEKTRYLKHIREIVYRLLHEATHLVWAMESGCSLKDQDLNINLFATELMAYGMMAVSGYVYSMNDRNVPVAFGPDHKFYQTVLREKDMKTVGRAFVDQFFSRIDFSTNRIMTSVERRAINGGFDLYNYMTLELADQLPEDLSCTN